VKCGVYFAVQTEYYLEELQVQRVKNPRCTKPNAAVGKTEWTQKIRNTSVSRWRQIPVFKTLNAWGYESGGWCVFA
jgi:hypothetical protein